MIGISGESLENLRRVARHAEGLITVHTLREVLGVSKLQANQLLYRWAKKGLLTRIHRGAYLLHPIGAEEGPTPIEDPFGVACQVFSPCFITGWSAAHHWGLTDQIFETLVIASAKNTNSCRQKLSGVSVVIRSVRPERIFGTVTTWQDGIEVRIADPSRTIIDVFETPRLAGGFRMAAEFFRNYLEHDEMNLQLLLDYGDRLGVGAVFKRLGFIAEALCPQESWFIEECHKRVTTGYSQLDPSVRGSKTVSKWHLQMPESLKHEFR